MGRDGDMRGLQSGHRRKLKQRDRREHQDHDQEGTVRLVGMQQGRDTSLRSTPDALQGTYLSQGSM